MTDTSKQATSHEEQTNQTEKSAPEKETANSTSQSFIRIPRSLLTKALLITAVVFLILAAYFFGKGDQPTNTATITSQQKKPTASIISKTLPSQSPKTLPNQPSASAIPNPSPNPNSAKYDEASMTDELKLLYGLTDKNAAFLTDTFATMVTISLENSGYIVEKERATAVSEVMQKLNTGTWNFSLSDPTNTNIKNQNQSSGYTVYVGTKGEDVLIVKHKSGSGVDSIVYSSTTFYQ